MPLVLESSIRLTLRALCRSHDRAKENFDLNFLLVAVRNVHNLIESFLPNGRSGLFKGSILAFDRHLTDRSLTFLIALNADFKRGIEEHQRSRDLKSAGQIKQFITRLECQRRRINHTEAVCREPLLYNEVDNCKGLGIEALVTLVIANVGTRPIGRDNLCWPEMQLGKGGFSGRRRAAKHDD